MQWSIPTATLILDLALSAVASAHGQKHGVGSHVRPAPGVKEQQPWGIAGDVGRVEPGACGEIVWHFNRAGELAYACLIPGHYEAGMWGRIRVLPR